jgi:hypothetical protein
MPDRFAIVDPSRRLPSAHAVPVPDVPHALRLRSGRVPGDALRGGPACVLQRGSHRLPAQLPDRRDIPAAGSVAERVPACGVGDPLVPRLRALTTVRARSTVRVS